MKKVMKMDEVADFIGVKRATVWGYVRERRLEAKKIGRSYYVYPEHMEQFLETWRPDLLQAYKEK